MANWIHDIEIKNFKSIRQAKIEDCRRVNVFIGYPNVGKSNLLEAVGLFTIDHNTKTEEFSSFVRLGNAISLFFNGNIEQNAEVTINDFVFVCRLSNKTLNFDCLLAKDTDEKLNVDNSKNDKVRSFQVQVEMKIEQIKNLKNFKSSELLPSIRKYQFKKQENFHSGNFEALSQPFGNNIFDVISAHESLRKDISKLFERYDLKFSYDYSTRTFRILKSVGDDIFLIPYSMIADTLQRLIFYLTAVQSNKDSVLLFEEPEAHMFPPYISKFTADVMHDKNNNQYFIATHSPFVLNDFMEDLDKNELSIYVVGYSDGETMVRRLTDDEITEIYQYGIDLFFNLENYLKDAV